MSNIKDAIFKKMLSNSNIKENYEITDDELALSHRDGLLTSARPEIRAIAELIQQSESREELDVAVNMILRKLQL